MGVTLAGTTQKNTGGVLAPNGDIYAIPRRETTNILKISAPGMCGDALWLQSPFLNKF
jgi:hypothetical protein